MATPQSFNRMPEPFVSAEVAAAFMGVKRRFLLSMARDGVAGAYPLGTGQRRRRNRWVFKLSELSSAVSRKSHGTPARSDRR